MWSSKLLVKLNVYTEFDDFGQIERLHEIRCFWSNWTFMLNSAFLVKLNVYAEFDVVFFVKLNVYAEFDVFGRIGRLRIGSF